MSENKEKLGSAGRAIITFSRMNLNVDGHIIVFIVLTVAAAEAAVGLAIIIMIFRNRETVNADKFNLLKR